MPDLRRAVVVGGSAGGSRAAERLAEGGAFAEVVVVSADPQAPYYQPAVSKQLLSGEWDVARARLPRREHPATRWLAGAAATRLDLDRRQLLLDDGTRIAANAVVLAPGCRPRTLPGLAAGPRVVILHRMSDALSLAGYLLPGNTLLIVGAGLIGSEVAAAAAKRGVRTTLVDPAPQPLVRALGPLGDSSCMRRHARHGCELLLGVGVSAVVEAGGEVRVTLTSGEVRTTDAVAVSIGVAPDTAWLAETGVPLLTDGGIRCDATLTVEDHPWLAAAGDAAAWWDAGLNRHVRVEHWFTALEHGALVADNLARPPAERVRFAEPPLFWTEQHGVTTHLIGRHDAASDWRAVEGSIDEDSYVAVARSGTHITAALLVGSAHRLGVYRKVIREGTDPPVRVGTP